MADAGRRFSDLAYESDLWSGAAPADPIPGQLSMTLPDPEADTATHEVEVRSNVVPLIRRTAVLDPVH